MKGQQQHEAGQWNTLTMLLLLLHQVKAICEEWRGRGGKWKDKKFEGAKALGKLKFTEGRDSSGPVEWRRFEQMGTVCV